MKKIITQRRKDTKSLLGLAGVMSLVLPGSGHFYVGMWQRGIGFMIGALLLCGFLYLNRAETWMVIGAWYMIAFSAFLNLVSSRKRINDQQDWYDK